ncbi:MAG: protein kinase, partial [Myxococcota bacterium]
MRLSVGARVGNYTLKYRLGQGGMAEVWAATHRVLSVDVALKVLFNTNPTLQNRLLQEGRAQAAMDHPNILPVRDVVDVDGAMGLVLPLIRGPSLDKLLQGYHPTRDEAVFLFQAIVEGVRHAHERGLIHRDLKPGNVLLEERNSHIVPRIADFGLVKNSAAPTQTRAHAVMGTLNYAAPEQFLDASSVDHRADLFSLGVIFTELLTGKCPFQGASVRGLLAAYEAGPNLSGVPQAFTGLCQALLAHEVNRRPADCTAVLDALHSAHPTGRASMLGLSSAVAKASRSRDAADVDETIPIRSDVAPDASAGSDDALTDAFPVRASPPRHNLPAEVDAFIGRSDALSVLSESLHSSRLVSILGIGGTGKTRLAVHFARHHISDYPGGVFFCDLSDARTLEGLLFVVAQVMDVPLSEGDPLKKLGHAIAGHGQCLMIFDNFEQLAAHAAETVGAWLKRAEAARFVVTSRALLEIHGEHPLRLAPLKDEEAVALFVERSAVKKRGFVLDDTNRDAIHQLVRLLDGLPLAIELATARIKLMTPQTMLSRMNHRFQLLSVGRRAVGRRAVGRPDTVKRQATLRATIDWSWNLLEDWEQSAFIQCSVFEGGFTLEAAEAVIDLSTIDDAPWAMDAVQSLVDKSLLVPLGENPLGKVRFGMLMSLHDYAHEKLNRLDAVESDTIRRRHLTVYEAFGRPEALAGLKRRDGGAQWWALLEEIDNLTAANRFAITIGAIEAAALTAMALYAIAERKQPALAIAALSNVLDLNPHQGEPHALPGLHSALGVLYFEQGQTERATRCYAQALARSRESGDRLHESEVLVCLGRLCQSQGNTVQAELHYQRALALLDEVGDPRREMMVLNPLGVLRNTQGRIQDADQCYQRALTIARTIHDRRTEGTVLANWGNLRMHQGQLEEASRFYRQALAIHREVGSRNRESMTLSNLGILHWH